MSYPARAKQLSLVGDELVPTGASAPVPAAAVPQVTPGAPKLQGGVMSGSGMTSGVSPTSILGDVLKGVSFDQPLTPQVGVGGPERWDQLRRATFSGDNLKYVATMTPNPIGATAVMQERPEVVVAFRDKLEKRRNQLSEAQIAKSPFWQKYDTQGQAFVAELLADVVGLLTRQERFAQQQANLRQLAPSQQQWVQNHPLAFWMDWI
jgi:hypothetical protein